MRPTACGPPISSRAGWTPLAARTFVQQQPSSIEIGVVAFSDGGLVTLPPTRSDDEVLAAIDRLTSQGATSLGQGIFTALSAISGTPITVEPGALEGDIDNIDIGYFGSSAVILLSDGENTSEPDPLDVAELAAVAGVKIYPIGLGSADGTVVEVDGFNVATALDEQLLEDIASVTDGQYFRAEDATSWPRCTTRSTCSSCGGRVPGDHRHPHGDQPAVAGGGGDVVAVVVRQTGLVVSFAWPLALLLLLAVPLLLGAYVWQLRRRRAQAVRFSNVALVREALPPRSRWRRHIPVALSSPA